MTQSQYKTDGKGKARVFTDVDLKKALAVASATHHPARDTALLCLSFGQGLRVKELSALSISDVYDRSGNLKETVTLTADMTKEGRPRQFYLVNPKVRQSLQAYLDFRRHDHRHAVAPDSPLFLSNKSGRFSPNSLQQVFKRIYTLAGIEGASSHSGRRTFATRLVSRLGTDIRDVAKLLGHLSIGTSLDYVEHNPSRLKTASKRVI